MSDVPVIPSYPFDPTGTRVSNRVSGEQQILTGANNQDFYIIVPQLAPFFENGLNLRFRGTDGILRALVKDVDYYCANKFVSASLACAKELFGTICFMNNSITGVVMLDYQHIGGDWTVVDTKVTEILADQVQNPRTTTWESVAAVPQQFPVVDHEWHLQDQVGLVEVTESLAKIEAALGIRKLDVAATAIQINNALAAYDTAEAIAMQQIAEQATLAGVAAHEVKINPHLQYLLKTEAASTYVPLTQLLAINAAIASITIASTSSMVNHIAAVDPHTQYLLKSAAASGYVAVNKLGAVNGVATLDVDGKLTAAQIPVSLLGALVYQGIWNASTNTPALVSGTGIKGRYYKVSVAGTTAIDGNAQWTVGDHIVFNGATWDRLEGDSTEVISVAGRTGVVVLTKSDVGLGNADNTSDANKPISTAQATAFGMKVNTSLLGSVNGVATLGADGKLTAAQIPSSLVGALVYQGLWDATTNTPTLVSSVGTKGHYYKASVAGVTSLNGNAQWQVGDHVIFDGTTWDRLEGDSTEVTSVAGRVGAVVLTKTDVGLANADNTSDVNKPVSTAQATAIGLKVNTSLLGVANGVATLGADGKLTAAQIPTTLLGALVYQGLWNAATNIPVLTSSVGTKGQYRKVSVAGTTNINGNAQWQVGDHIIFNGTTWDRLEGDSTEVISVNGQSGTVVLSKADIGLGNASNTSDANKPVSIAQAAADAVVLASAAADATAKADAARESAVTASTPIAHAGSGGNAHAVAVSNGANGFMSGVDKKRLDDYYVGRGVANGTATLGGDGKLTASQIPTSLLGALVYQGVWNALTNFPILTSSVGTKGQYYKVSVAGITAINGNAQWNVGDHIIFNGTTWDRLEGDSTEVVSVAGRTGAVVLVKGDVGLGNVDNTSDVNKPVSNAQAAANTVVQLAAATDATTKANAAQTAAIAASTPAAHVGAGGTAHAAATTTVAGFMTATDKVKLNGIAAGATANLGTITSVTATGPVKSSGGTTPVISMDPATNLVAGYLSAADYATFAAKQNALGFTPVNTAVLGAANGVATLGGDGKLTTAQIPSSLVGALVYQGTWNASTNTPAIVASVGTKGQYRKVSVAGVTSINGNAQWNVGDHIIFNGATWDRLEGDSTEVTSVAGRVGAVVLAKNDVGLANVDNTSDANKPVSTAQAAADTAIKTAAALDATTKANAAQAASAPVAHVGSGGNAHADVSTTTDGFMTASDKIKLNGIATGATANLGTVTAVTATGPILSSGGTTPVISMPVATNTVSGYLSAADRTAFNNKQAALGFTPANSADLGAINGIATLGADGKLTTTQIPSSLVGALVYQGTWNALNNSPTLTSFTGVKGHYFKVSVAGTTNISGNAQWQVGDHIIFNGSGWDRLEGDSTEVTSVAGRIGAVVLTKTDVGLTNVDNTSDVNKPISTAQWVLFDKKVSTELLGANNGVATLGDNGLLSPNQIPLGAVTGIHQGTSSAGTSCIMFPEGAFFGSNSSSAAGAFRIGFPVGRFGKGTKFKMRVELCDFAAGESVTLMISGYAETDNSWSQRISVVIAGESDNQYNVHFGNDGMRSCIWIGDATTSFWSYPRIYVSELLVTWNSDGAPIDAWKTGWSLTLDPTMAEPNVIHSTMQTTYPYAQGLIPDATLTGTSKATRLRLTASSDAGLTSTNHAFQIGDDAGQNVIFDSNEIMARNNGAAAALFISYLNVTDIVASNDIRLTSDARYKTNFRPIASALDKVDMLNGVTFDPTDGEEGNITGERKTGLIAQDAIKALPELVTADKTGKLSVSYSGTAGLFAEAIKEQRRNFQEMEKALVDAHNTIRQLASDVSALKERSA